MLVIIGVLAFSLAAAQKQPYDWKHAIAPAALSFSAGAAWGTHETLMHHYPKFQRAFPNADPQWWNPAISWENKHKSDVPVWFSDAKHTLASTSQVCLFGAGLTITLGERRPILHHLLDIGISAGAYTLGNMTTYNWIFKN